MNFKFPPLPDNCYNCALYKCSKVSSPYCAQNGFLTEEEQVLSHKCFYPAIDILLEEDKDFANIRDMTDAYKLCEIKYLEKNLPENH